MKNELDFLTHSGNFRNFWRYCDEKAHKLRKKIFLLLIAIQFSLSFCFLSSAMREISMTTAYAIWTGLGAAGGVMIGMLFFKENKSLAKISFLSLILISSVSLKLIV